jgi:hypothetical protein
MPKAPAYVYQYLQRLYKRVQARLAVIETHAKSGKGGNENAIRAIVSLKPLTDDVNQFHHEYLCLRALQKLKRMHPELAWQWHPTDTGSGSEADLEGRDARGRLVVAAECSASIEPKGSLRERMNVTLMKLSKIRCKNRYYFVTGTKMETAARNRAKSKGHRITAMRLT